MKTFVRDPILQNSVEFIRNNEKHPAMVNLNAVQVLLQALVEREKEIQYYRLEVEKLDRQNSDLLWAEPEPYQTPGYSRPFHRC